MPRTETTQRAEDPQRAETHTHLLSEVRWMNRETLEKSRAYIYPTEDLCGGHYSDTVCDTCTVEFPSNLYCCTYPADSLEYESEIVAAQDPEFQHTEDQSPETLQSRLFTEMEEDRANPDRVEWAERVVSHKFGPLTSRHSEYETALYWERVAYTYYAGKLPLYTWIVLADFPREDQSQ